jgi:chemotaxis protein MotB
VKGRSKKHHEDHVNHEAWAIPYADLMTLLLAFFVVMYAVSVVNEGKYRVMSESIIEAFNGSSHVIAPMPEARAKPRNVDPAMASPSGQPGAAADPLNVPIPARPSPMRVADVRVAAQMRDQRRNLEVIRDQVQRALQPLIDKQMVVVRKTTSWLEIELRTDILFPSGVAKISEQADPVLDQLATILQPFPNPVRIEGYTDDRPINTALYPSNWELSAARAASVARMFSEHGVDPQRLGIVGWSEYRPSADNSTEDGRNHNRRVLVVILSEDAAPHRLFNDAQKGQFAGNDDTPASATSVGGTLPMVQALAKAPLGAADALPANKVLLVHPPMSVPPVAAPATDDARRALPGATAGAMTLGAPRLTTPEHGP